MLMNVIKMLFYATPLQKRMFYQYVCFCHNLAYYFLQMNEILLHQIVNFEVYTYQLLFTLIYSLYTASYECILGFSQN